MPVLSMMRIPGDAEDIAAAMQEHVAPVTERLAPKHGGLAHIAARADGGLLIVNLWETEEGRHRMAEEPEVQEALRKAGLPEPAFEGHEVLWFRVTERATELAGV